MNEPLIAYVYGETPPDFATIAAFGFDVVCLDSGAPWFNHETLMKARQQGLMAVAFHMGYVAPTNQPSRRARRSLGGA